MTDLPIVSVPSSSRWEIGYELGRFLDERYPEQCAEDFGQALLNNTVLAGQPFGHDNTPDIIAFTCVQEGERDEGEWIWRVTFEGGEVWVATGWCDYTGWDCQSGFEWERVPE